MKAQKIHFSGKGSMFPYGTGTAILFPKERILAGMSNGVAFTGFLLENGEIRVGGVCDEYLYEVVSEVEVSREFYENALKIIEGKQYIERYIV
ncbi:MAG: hypothetical protein WC884_00300 [Candidatus Paceibacterota bacterium]